MHLNFYEAITSATHWLAAIITIVTVIAVFSIHYLMLDWLNQRANRVVRKRRPRVLFIVLITLLAHVLEISLFGSVYAMMLKFPAMGHLVELPHAGLLDSLYFSATVFTTLGFGDLTPSGPLAFMVGVESLCGLMLITWSASFTYLEMGRNWE